MRIEEHPIIDFNRRDKINFNFNGGTIEAYEGETIAAALYAAGVKVLGHSLFKHRPRGLYCAIGNCSSCLMTVNGVPNVRICVTKAEDGMMVKSQIGRGELL
ncbi:(2Fe-2S)-binding protein [Oceanirhabdus sp. W0125-5]|uniref:(2Fe-2S)-binding protein n=1 Tax=Oceanirhabdus sp. W0125-5 TaxID=2999116 RepID=UPI0022F2DD71|nr:(2Fe-2S)-binding protein [Oceanirhabdus sp. W0125-5]WBW95561.1 (2Fe-2S)-binding protein [Oceanirhabdus sp. W0125-5]